MAKDLNKAQLIGNLGADPEFKMVRETGKQIATFSVATSERWKDKDGKPKHHTEWHRVVLTGDNLIAIAKEHLKKGGRVYVEGTLKTHTWQDRTTTEIFVQQSTGVLSVLSGPTTGGANEAASVPGDCPTVPLGTTTSEPATHKEREGE